ncbi:MAG: hypothetical protein DRQ10_02515 [Candidatus Hydrothermota bacterium]|nr:MAG: hypothetical protein DRQ10_02515 [Candidatus Hydrothermae bacterium]
MRPLKLRLKGLNSYRHEALIDFERITRHGIFGIFGHTGAGKSTLLDAITFALYGRTDRLGAQIDEAINRYVGHVFVDFEFEASGGRFRVKREKSLRKRKQSESRLYSFRDGNWVPIAEKSTEFENHRNAILGNMKFEDFTRVVILPQGKFAEFLDTKPAKRAEMLARIFNLEIYGDVYLARVKERLERLRGEFGQLERSIDALKDATPERLGELKTKLADLQKLSGILSRGEQRILKRVELLRRFKELVETKGQIERQIQIHLRQKDEIEALRRKLESAERLALLEDVALRYKELKRSIPLKLKELSEKQKLLNKKLQALQHIEDEQRDFEEHALQRIAELSKRERELELALELEKRRRELKNAIAEIKAKGKKLGVQKQKAEAELNALEAKELAVIDSKIAEIQKIQDQIEKEMPKVELSSEVLSQIESGISQHKQTIRDIETFASQQSEMERRLAKVWTSAFGELEMPDSTDDALSIFDSEMERLEKEIEIAHSKNLALELAMKLKDGEPCPVCGSIHHPAPLSPSDVPDASKSRKLKLRLNRLRKLKDEFIGVMSQLAGVKERISELQKRKATIERDVLDLLGGKDFKLVERMLVDAKRAAKLKERKAKLTQKLADVLGKRARITEKINKLRSKIGEIEQELAAERQNWKLKSKELEDIQAKLERLTRGEPIEALLASLRKERKSIETERRNLQRKFRSLRTEVDQLQGLVAKLKGEVETMRRSFEQAESKLLGKAAEMGVSLEELMEQIVPHEQRQKMRAEIEEWEKRLNDLKARLSQIEQKISEMGVESLPDGEPMRSERALKRLKERISALDKEIGETRGEIKRTEADILRANELRSRIAEVEKQIALHEELEKLMRGKGLVKFISKFLLDEIVSEANFMLDDLTGGKLHLALPDERLDFKVFDLTDGRTRSVKTLSGGEKFMVSFALALALSSYIQRMRARTINFFFIDEGFGTLDSERQEAVGRVLEEMMRTGRTVGLITHVDAYKHLVPCYILVEKDEIEGSRVRMVCS